MHHAILSQRRPDEAQAAFYRRCRLRWPAARMSSAAPAGARSRRAARGGLRHVGCARRRHQQLDARGEE